MYTGILCTINRQHNSKDRICKTRRSSVYFWNRNLGGWIRSKMVYVCTCLSRKPKWCFMIRMKIVSSLKKVKNKALWTSCTGWKWVWFWFNIYAAPEGYMSVYLEVTIFHHERSEWWNRCHECEKSTSTSYWQLLLQQKSKSILLNFIICFKFTTISLVIYRIPSIHC